jgi:hypothetical protein
MSSEEGKQTLDGTKNFSEQKTDFALLPPSAEGNWTPLPLHSDELLEFDGG